MSAERTRTRIVMGNVAGHHFYGEGDLAIVRHCKRGKQSGYYHVRKWLADRSAFNYDPSLGWAYERWFQWDEDSSQGA